MFFTAVGRIIAKLVFLFGAMLVVSGFVMANSGVPGASMEYYNLPTTGAVIDKGLFYLLLATALGVVTDISRLLGTPKVTAESKPQVPE